MAKRYYISPVIGTGAREDPYRAQIQDSLPLGTALTSLIASKPDGSPKFAFALCIIAATNHATLVANSLFDSLPDITLDSQLSVLTTAQKNALLAFASKRGISTAGLTNASTFRQVLERIGKYIDLNFTALNFDANNN